MNKKASLCLSGHLENAFLALPSFAITIVEAPSPSGNSLVFWEISLYPHSLPYIELSTNPSVSWRHRLWANTRHIIYRRYRRPFIGASSDAPGRWYRVALSSWQVDDEKRIVPGSVYFLLLYQSECLALFALYIMIRPRQRWRQLVLLCGRYYHH